MDARTATKQGTGGGGPSLVRDYMRAGTVSVDFGGTVGDALKVMIKTGRPKVLVMDGEEVVGLIGAGDIVFMVAGGRDSSSVLIRDFMNACLLTGSQPCVQVRDNELMINVIKVMDMRSTDEVIVVDEKNKVVGTISALDALRGWKEEVSGGRSDAE